MKKGRRRMLIQAPSGSGKTLLCVKLAVDWAEDEREERGGGAFFGPAQSDDVGSWAVLLLTHSAALAEQTAEEVAVEMSTRSNAKSTWSPMEGACPAGHGYVAHVAESPKVQVHVMTIDGLTDFVRSSASAGRGGELQYHHVVVDEGHEVFSYQPHAWLVGQHRFRDPGRVRDALNGLLADPSTARLVVFHDKSYQHIGAARPDPVWPHGCIESRVPLPIVRNPGPVRDAAVQYVNSPTVC
jgi:superfamily II DNA or RNA helicase